jgi:hypothetical protein
MQPNSHAVVIARDTRNSKGLFAQSSRTVDFPLAAGTFFRINEFCRGRAVRPCCSAECLIIRLVKEAKMSGSISAVTASAAIVCSGNTCWRAHERYTNPPSAGVVIHEDNWRAGPGITFREHEGRGYWRGDSWTDF